MAHALDSSNDDDSIIRVCVLASVLDIVFFYMYLTWLLSWLLYKEEEKQVIQDFETTHRVFLDVDIDGQRLGKKENKFASSLFLNWT